jgi:hypothetical protein
MPAIQPDGPVSAGLAAQPLVSPLNPAVNTSAVESLVDSFRKGFITAEDIHNAIGPVGQAKKKAELTLNTEVAAPTAVEARKTALEASTAKAQLEAAAANAGQANVAPSAALTGEQIAAQRQLLPAQTALSAKQLELNAQFLYPKAIYDIATSRLKGTPVDSVDPKTGTPIKQFRNELGEDVTPPAGAYPGSEDFHRYSQLAQRAFANLNLGQAQTTPSGSAPSSTSLVQPKAAAPAAQSPSVSPAQTFVSEAAPVDQQRADLLKSGKFDMHEVQTMSDADIIDAHKQLLRFLGSGASAVSATPAVAPAVAPVVEPAASTPPTVEPTPQGIQTGMSKNFMSAPEIGADLRKQKSYELWDQQKGFANSFATAADRISKIPIEEQRSGKAKMNSLDLALAESIIKLYDPGMAIREFKWEKLAEAQPYLEKLPNWRAEFLHTGSLTPEGRQRLIELGYDSVKGKENAILPQLQFAVKRAEQSGLPPESVLNPDELRVLHGKSFGHPPAEGSPSSPQGKIGTIPGIGTGTFDPRTGIFTVQ